MNPAYNRAYFGRTKVNGIAASDRLTPLQRWAQAVARCCPNRSFLEYQGRVTDSRWGFRNLSTRWANQKAFQ